MKKFLSLFALTTLMATGLQANDRADALLFHLSCDHGLNAEVSQGKATPNG